MKHGLGASFRFAIQGLGFALRTQRTLRLHLLAGAIVGAVILGLDLPASETAILILAIVVVLAAELFNTGVEAIVDLLVTDDHHVAARIAKDVAAASVLVAAVGAALVGAVILLPKVR